LSQNINFPLDSLSKASNLTPQLIHHPAKSCRVFILMAITTTTTIPEQLDPQPPLPPRGQVSQPPRRANPLRSVRTQVLLVTFIISIAALAAFSLHPALADTASSTPNASSMSSATPTPVSQTLGPQGQPELLSLTNAGLLADLRWPNFNDYQGQVAMFYAGNGYALSWITGGSATLQALAMIDFFKHADAKGLNPDDYDASRWAARVAKLAPANSGPAITDQVHFDLAMTVCAMRYFSDLDIGRVNPNHVKFSQAIGTKTYDLADFLRQQVSFASDVSALVASVEPHYAGYQRALSALVAYMKLAQQGDGPPLPMVQSSIHPRANYAGAPQLAARLRLLGDLASGAELPNSQTEYAGALVDAVKRFQLRHGLEPDGVLGRGTVANLNTPLSHRVEQLQFTLERYRWIPPGFSQPPIIVNLPQFVLRTMRRQPAPFLTMRVVVGKAYRRQTPVFAGNMQYVIFRPYWNVPPSIQQAELVPKLSQDRDYLASHGFEVTDGNDVVTGGTVSDDVLHQLRAGRLSIRQKPGPKNALGLVKFIFPNSYDVYLHSTPTPQLFARARRDFSHGCIRVEDPLALALWVLRDDPNWTKDKIAAAMNGDQTVQVNLTKPIPVLIIYSTAVVEPSGEMMFFDDIYHYDTELEGELAHGYPYPGPSAIEAARLATDPTHHSIEKSY
jgi:murein L,D-transpeptidase YcbB/YkuD